MVLLPTSVITGYPVQLVQGIRVALLPTTVITGYQGVVLLPTVITGYQGGIITYS